MHERNTPLRPLTAFIGEPQFGQVSTSGSGSRESKRMLEAYMNHESLGGTNERIRKYARSALDLANQLTHDRTVTSRELIGRTTCGEGRMIHVSCLQ